MQYEEVLEFLYERLPYYQRSGPAAYKGNLDNTLALDRLFNHPHRNFPSIHVAGTNGKGSVSHMLAAVLQQAGFRTGLYTSPHLKDFRERIRINGVPVSRDFVTRFVERYLELNEHEGIEPSFFELTVLMAFDYFAAEKVDIAVIETGLGGRLDSTNIITPLLSVITNISKDHTNLLGDTLGRIALEKAGIIKPGVPVIIGETHPQTEQIFRGKAEENRSTAWFADQLFRTDYAMLTPEQQQLFNVRTEKGIMYENLKLDLLGRYQAKNLCTLLAAVQCLENAGWHIPEEKLRSGLSDVTGLTGLQGRWQILGANPRIICDTAHNEGGVREVVEQLRQTPCAKLRIVFGMVNDKDISGVLALLPKDAIYYFTRASVSRALDENQLMKMASAFGLHGQTYPDVPGAVAVAKAEAGIHDTIFIGGSTFVVADVLS